MADDNSAAPLKRKPGRPPKARGAANSSDDGEARWTIRGVKVNVREMAVKGASAKGLTVGDWLEEAVIAYYRGNGNMVSADGSANVPALPMGYDLPSVLTEIQDRLAKLETVNKPENKKGLFVRMFGKSS